MSVNRVIFFLFREVHVLDLAGAAQAFYESGYYGHPYEMIYVSDDPSHTCSSGLQLAKLQDLSLIEPGAADVIVVPGYDLRQLQTGQTHPVYAWLRKASDAGAVLCSICTGAFTLAEAGLLEDRPCTTHWKYTDRLQQQYPQLKVETNKVFVRSGNIFTSAGVTTGLDMILALLEERHGAELAFRVARELVMYIRRDGGENQESIYLQYRSHMHAGIHSVQDWVIQHLGEKIRIGALAELIFTSPRNLTRLFKTVTGITIGQYIEKLRAEKALQMLEQDLKIGDITRRCGLNSTNQLRTIVKRHTGSLPSQLKSAQLS